MSLRARTVPRKRPKQLRSLATVDAILVATARVLVKEGFDRASTNRIAAAAGVSIGSLYQYFPSKEALVAALVERHCDEMSLIIGEAVERIWNLPLPQAARQMAEVMVKAHAVDPRLHRVLIEQVPRIGRLEKVNDVELHFTRLTRAYLEAHRDEVRPKDLDAAAFVVVQAVESITHGAVLHNPERLTSGDLVDEITELVVRYLSIDVRTAATPPRN